MVILLIGSSTLSSVSKRMVYIASLATWERARSSASVVEVVTVSCLFAFQAIKPPNSLIANP